MKPGDAAPSNVRPQWYCGARFSVPRRHSCRRLVEADHSRSRLSSRNSFRRTPLARKSPWGRPPGLLPTSSSASCGSRPEVGLQAGRPALPTLDDFHAHRRPAGPWVLPRKSRSIWSAGTAPLTVAALNRSVTFMPIGGPKGDGYSLTVAVLKRAVSFMATGVSQGGWVTDETLEHDSRRRWFSTGLCRLVRP